jgi:hypothetical protein
MKLIFLLILCVFSWVAHAEEPPLTSIRADIFAPRWEFRPQISVFSPGVFSLTADGTKVETNQPMEGFFSAQLNLGYQLMQIGPVTLTSFFSGSYGTKETVFLKSNAGSSLPTLMRWNWFSFGGGLRGTYPIPGLEFFCPSLSIGLGTHALSSPSVASIIFSPYLIVSPPIPFGQSNPTRVESNVRCQRQEWGAAARSWTKACPGAAHLCA